MNNKNTNSADTRRGTLRMMLEMVGLVAPLKFQMMGAILLGVVGFLLSFGLGIFGGYAVVSLLLYQLKDLRIYHLGDMILHGI